MGKIEVTREAGKYYFAIFFQANATHTHTLGFFSVEDDGVEDDGGIVSDTPELFLRSGKATNKIHPGSFSPTNYFLAQHSLSGHVPVFACLFHNAS